jgi:hypothetical protein
VRELHAVAQRCLEHTKGRRADVHQIVSVLEAARAAAEACRPVARGEFCCPLSLETMADPVVAADGQTYERAHISRWFESHDVSPVTNQPLSHKHLVPNLALKNLIAERNGASHY